MRTSFRNELEQSHIESEDSIAKRGRTVPEVGGRRIMGRQRNQPKIHTGTLSKKKQHQR